MVKTVKNLTRNKVLIDIVIRSIEKFENPNIKLLDAGCGDGTISKAIKEQFNECEIIGEDISIENVEKAKNNGIFAIRLDLTKDRQPYPDNYFDVVIMARVLEHLSDPDFCLMEINRVLKVNGILFVSTPNLSAWFNRLALLCGIQPIFTEVSTKKIVGRKFKFLGEGNPTVGHIRVFTAEALKTFLQMYGFKIVKVVGAAFLDDKRLFMVDKLLSKIPNVASYLIVKTIKFEKLHSMHAREIDAED